MSETCSCSCGLSADNQNFPTVKPEQFAKDIIAPDIFLVDVRTPEEFKDGHIKGAFNLDVTNPDFDKNAEKELPKDKTIAVYCGSGKRSAMAASRLTALGFKVLNMEGGLTAWIAAGLPTVK